MSTGSSTHRKVSSAKPAQRPILPAVMQPIERLTFLITPMFRECSERDIP